MDEVNCKVYAVLTNLKNTKRIESATRNDLTSKLFFVSLVEKGELLKEKILEDLAIVI